MAFFEKIRFIISEVTIVIRHTLEDWVKDNIPTYGAALAFYTIFSVAPLLIIMVAIAGFVFGESATTGQLEGYLSELMGEDLARTLQNFVLNAYRPTSGIIATGISLAFIIFLSTTIVTQLKKSLNNIWNIHIKSNESEVKRFFFNRVIALLLILIFASMFVLSIMIELVLNTLEARLDLIIFDNTGIWSKLNSLFSFLVLVALFAIVFKLLPDIQVRWRDVLMGAVVTSLLFLFGRYLITLYIGLAASSTYGAAGSFVVFLIWVYYNAMVFFLGAEFTYVYTMRYGKGVKPSNHAVMIKEYKRDA